MLWLMTSITFFFNTWEEYETDKFDLPIINGVNEGCLIACLVMIFTAVVGGEFWLQTFDFMGQTWRYNNATVVAFFASSMLFCLWSIYQVLTHIGQKSKIERMSNCVVFLFLVFTIFILLDYSNCSLLKEKPKIILYLYGFVFARSMVGINLLTSIGDFATCSFVKCEI
jgi:hypothetical protein